jgi:3-oxoadipate enol-lactonase
MFKTSDGCTIAYTIHAARKRNAPRMVLIHSLALDSSIWDGVVAKLDGRAEILAYDCRGHGRSGRQTIPFTIELFAHDLRELLDHVAWPEALIGGCSMGGCVAQAFAAEHPSRVTALALVDTTAWYGDDAPKTWSERAAAAQSKGLAALVDFQITRWFGDSFRATQPQLVQAVTRVFLANDVSCYASSCMLLGAADLRSKLPAFRMPAAIIVGEEDYATPISAAHELHNAIAGSTLTVLPKARHLTPIECPDQLASELLALSKRSPAGHD